MIFCSNLILTIDRKGLHLNLMPRNMNMSNFVERSIANEENI